MRAAAVCAVVVVSVLVVSLECVRVGASVSTTWGVQDGLVNNAAASDPVEDDVDKTSTTATAHSARRHSTHMRASGALSVKYCGVPTGGSGSEQGVSASYRVLYCCRQSQQQQLHIRKQYRSVPTQLSELLCCTPM